MGLFTNKGFSSMISKRALCIGTFIFSLTILHAQVQRDKVLHFGGGVLSGAAGALVANKLSDGNRFWTFTGAVGGSLIAGVVKETIDQGKSDNRWDNGDLAATVFGGVTVGVTIDLFSGKKRRNKNTVSVGLR